MNFSLEKIKNLKLLIIPNGALMPDEHVDIIKQYVSMGGGLIASYETSLYDEKGLKRKDFLLADLFGAHYCGTEKTDRMENNPRSQAYMKVEDSFKSSSFLKGIEDPVLIPAFGNYCQVKVQDSDTEKG